VDGLLFTEGELRTALEHQADRMRAAIEAVPEEHLLQAEVEEWAAALADEFQVEAPELQVDQMYREPAKEIKVDVSQDPGRYFSPNTTDHRIAGYRVVVRVPFTGDKGVFELRPNQFTFNPPRARVDGNDLAVTLDYPHDKQPDIDVEANGTIGTVQQWLGWARGEIESFNRTLEQHARSTIAGRRQRIEQREQHLATSSIPERRPGDGKTYIPDVIVRRPAPKLPKAKTDGGGVQLEPVLEDRVFDHILSVVRMQAREMERAPKTYTQMEEEARRDLFLATLNTHYEGRGSAEAFNVDGKTDILIRYEHKSLFIAECKFWQGAKGFTDAIGQLFGYASWRDTKLALIIFVREKGMTEIVEKGRSALAAHPQFVAWETAVGDTELRAIMSWPGDDRRHADLNVFFVHTLQ
jgi:hypothetical protein